MTDKEPTERDLTGLDFEVESLISGDSVKEFSVPLSYELIIQSADDTIDGGFFRVPVQLSEDRCGIVTLDPKDGVLTIRVQTLPN